MSTHSLSQPILRHKALALAMARTFPEADEETLADTLEGVSDLPGLLSAMIRSRIQDEALAEALRRRIDEMRQRLERIEVRAGQKKALVLAAKEAETDATKRALVTFGNAFGLCLYDKVQSGLRRPRKPRVTAQPVRWLVRPVQGEPTGFADPVAFCSALRKLLTDCGSREQLTDLWSLNAETVAGLSADLPALRTERGEHYGEILSALYRKQLEALAPAPPAIDKSRLAISEPRRVRDKQHLRAVAKHPCLICGRTPSHAHHLRFAQARALARKPSDEFTVPLCRLHHRAVHQTGDEKLWWSDNKLDPLPEAERLWVASKSQNSQLASFRASG